MGYIDIGDKGKGLLELSLAVSSRAVFVELIAYAASMTGVQLGKEGERFWGGGGCRATPS